MKIGFIGQGNMGSMIIRGLLNSGALNQHEIIISSRTMQKLENIKKEYPHIEITDNNKYLAQKSSKIFIFVKTGVVKEIIEDINPEIREDSHLIYIAAGLTMKNIEKIFNGKISKLIPSLASKMNEGVSLIYHNEKVDKKSANFINRLFEAIGDVKIIPEKDFEVASDLTSCAPAFIASIFRYFAESGAKHGNLTIDDAEEMVIKTLYGTSKLLYEGKMSFNDIISSVATKRGITEEGIKILEKEMPKTFDNLFNATLDKYKAIESDLDYEYNISR